MADIKQLKEVMSSLEAQSKELSGFHGLLTKVETIHGELSESNQALSETMESLRDQLKLNISEFERFDQKMIRLEKSLHIAKSMVSEIYTAIGKLEFVTPQQLNNGIEKVNGALAIETAALSESLKTVNKSVASNRHMMAYIGIANFIGIVLLIANQFGFMAW